MAFFVLSAILMVLAAIGIVAGKAKAQAAAETQDAAGVRFGKLATQGAAIGFVVLFVGLILIRSLHSVGTGHVGLVTQFGNVVDSKDAGFVVIAPWQSISEISVRTQKATYAMETGAYGSAFSIDNQNVFATVTLNFQIDPKHAVELFRRCGTHCKEILIDPRVPQVFKATTAQYRAVSIAGNREKLRRQTQQTLDRQLEQFGIQAVDTLIQNVHFTPEFQRALEETQVARQRAIQEQARVEIAKAKANQRREQARGIADANAIEAEGQARANKVLAASLSEKVIQFKAIEKLSPNVQTVLLPAGANLLLPKEVIGK